MGLLLHLSQNVRLDLWEAKFRNGFLFALFDYHTQALHHIHFSCVIIAHLIFDNWLSKRLIIAHVTVAKNKAVYAKIYL